MNPDNCVQAQARIWPDIGRESEIDQVARILSTRGSPGVLILGEQGSGKTWVARRALATVDAQVYALRATPMVSRLPLGGLGPLLTHLDERPQDALAALHPLARYFESRSTDQPVVVYVSSAQYLDDSSAMVLSQLAISGYITLLATSNPRPHPELMELVDDDGLSVVRLSPLSVSQVTRITAGYLGSVVSGQAQSAIVSAVNGNPFWLKLLLDELLASDTLVRRSGVWVLTRPELQDWFHNGATRHARSRLARLSDQQRDVLEIVAVCEPATWSLLIAVTSTDQVDELVDLGLLTVSGRPATVAFQPSLFGEIIRQTIPRSRRLAIRARVNAQVDRAKLPLARLMRFVDLDLACDHPPPLSDAIMVADHALSNVHPSYALKVLDAVDPSEADHEGRWATWQLLRAAALVVTDGPASGLDALESLCRRDDLTVDTFAAAHIRKAWAAGASGDTQGAEHILSGAVHSLNDYPAGPAREAASRRLIVAQLCAAVDGERYADSIEPLEQVFSDPALETELQIKTGAALAECALVTGRLRTALDVASWFSQKLAFGSDLPMRTYWKAGTSAVAVFMEANQWSTTVELVDRLLNRARRFKVTDGGVMETTRGAVLLRRGQVRAALDHLEAGLAALEAVNRITVYPLAMALAGSALTALGDENGAERYFNRAEQTLWETPLPGYMKTQVELHALTARAKFGGQGARRDLTEFADRMGRIEHRMAEIQALFTLALLGDADATQRLVTRAGEVEGEQARIIQIYAEAKLGHDPERFATAAQLAESSGQLLLAADMAAEGLSVIAAAPGDKIIIRNSLRALFHRCRTACGAVDDARFATEYHPATDPLTQREREIIRYVAAGKSNRDIADALTVSVRTIEGHLYRIYPKLGVTRRSEVGKVTAA